MNKVLSPEEMAEAEEEIAETDEEIAEAESYDPYESLDSKIDVEKLLSLLPVDGAILIRRVYLDGYTYEELACLYRQPIRRLQGRVTRLIQTLRDVVLENEGLRGLSRVAV